MGKAEPHRLFTEMFGVLDLPADPRRRPPDADILARTRELVSRSKAKETFRSYRTGWRQWTEFCAARGYAPLAGDPQPVAFFLAHLSRSRSYATVRSRLAAVAAAHKVAGIPLDLRSGVVTSVLDGFRREQGTRSRKQAAPLLIEALPRFAAAFDPATPRGARDRALLLVGFGAALRRSELVGLDVGDVTIEERGLVVHLRRSKTDQQGEGYLLGVHRGANSTFCPVSAVEAWLDHRGCHPGPLFTRVRKGGRVTRDRLSAQSVSLIVKRGADALGLDARTFSGHSLRAGLATSAALAGADLAAIMEQTRHRSVDTARRYIRNAEIWRNNVTRPLFTK